MIKTIIFMLCVSCCFSGLSKESTKPAKVLILTGMEHSAHNWRTRTAALMEVLATKDFIVDVSSNPEFLADDKLFDYDVILFNFYSGKKNYPGDASRKNLLKYVKQGGGAFILHFACGNFSDWPEWTELTGLRFKPNPIYKGLHDRYRPFIVDIINEQHPSMAQLGKKKLQANDELYYCLGDATSEYQILATAKSENTKHDHPMALTVNYGKGRVYNTPLGHDAKSVKMADVAKLIRHGLLWAAGKENLIKK